MSNDSDDNVIINFCHFGDKHLVLEHIYEEISTAVIFNFTTFWFLWLGKSSPSDLHLLLCFILNFYYKQPCHIGRNVGGTITLWTQVLLYFHAGSPWPEPLCHHPTYSAWDFLVQRSWNTLQCMSCLDVL